MIYTFDPKILNELTLRCNRLTQTMAQCIIKLLLFLRRIKPRGDSGVRADGGCFGKYKATQIFGVWIVRGAYFLDDFCYGPKPYDKAKFTFARLTENNYYPLTICLTKVTSLMLKVILSN